MSIEKITDEIIKVLKSGAILPGGIKSQYSVCGKMGCKCMDPENPIKHGPYDKLSFSVSGKSSTLFIRQNDLREAQKVIERFNRLKGLCNELALAYVDLIRARGFSTKNLPVLDQIPLRLINTNIKTIIEKSRDRWKRKSLVRQTVVKGYKIKVRDLIKSRLEWKKKAVAANVEIENLKKQLSAVNNELKNLKKKQV